MSGLTVYITGQQIVGMPPVAERLRSSRFMKEIGATIFEVPNNQKVQIVDASPEAKDDGLPSAIALDAAAKAAGYRDWLDTPDSDYDKQVCQSIIAHARTIEDLWKHTGRPADAAELKRRQDAREIAVGTVGVTPGSGGAWSILTGTCDHSDSVQAAYRMACLKDGTTPVPLSEWSK